MGVVRGTRIKIVVIGSLARGFSDYKYVAGFPKPTDYELPRTYRKAINAEIGVQADLKSKFSDLDLVIVNSIIYDSIFSQYRNRCLPAT